MKRLLCISALALFMCGCGGEAEQQAVNIQTPPTAGTNLPPATSDDNESGNSNSSATRPRPPKMDPVENSDTTASSEEVGTSEDANNSDVHESDSNGDRSGDSETAETVRPPRNGRASREPAPKPAVPAMLAAFPSTLGTVGLSTGNLIPEIAGIDLEGVDFKLSDYKGKVIMLDFWGDW